MKARGRKKGRAPRIVVLGGINTDYVVRTPSLPKPGQSVQGDPLFTGPGGKGANQAVAAARLGAKVTLIGSVGNEPRGKKLVRALRKNKIDTRHVGFEQATPTGAAIIGVDPQGEKQISAGLGANMKLRRGAIREATKAIRRADALLANFEVPMECVLSAAKIAKKFAVKVVLDPAPPTKIPAKLLKMIYAIRPNADEAAQITRIDVKNRASARRAGRQLLKRGVKIVALQAGDSGDLVLSEGEEVFVRRLKVKTVDATGAGDAFAAAFTVAVAEGAKLRTAAHFANVAAALATTRMGAQDGMPKRAKVMRMLRARGKAMGKEKRRS